jgi:hypothetical protein
MPLSWGVIQLDISPRDIGKNILSFSSEHDWASSWMRCINITKWQKSPTLKDDRACIKTEDPTVLWNSPSPKNKIIPVFEEGRFHFRTWCLSLTLKYFYRGLRYISPFWGLSLIQGSTS